MRIGEHTAQAMLVLGLFATASGAAAADILRVDTLANGFIGGTNGSQSYGGTPVSTGNVTGQLSAAISNAGSATGTFNCCNFDGSGSPFSQSVSSSSDGTATFGSLRAFATATSSIAPASANLFPSAGAQGHASFSIDLAFSGLPIGSPVTIKYGTALHSLLTTNYPPLALEFADDNDSADAYAAITDISNGSGNQVHLVNTPLASSNRQDGSTVATVFRRFGPIFWRPDSKCRCGI